MPQTESPLTPDATVCDYALVGGGLQNGLLALAIRHYQPDARIVLIERDDRLGGNHTWSLHDGDVTPATMKWLEPLLAHRWPGYQVQFPELARRVGLGYSALTSVRFHAVVHAAVGQGPGALMLNTTAMEVAAQHVVLADGRRINAAVVVEALGPERTRTPTSTGWQKFVGLEIVTAKPHGLSEPIVMDARVPQVDGMHFVYTLPLDPYRLLVEDTVFSDTATLHAAEMRLNALAYAEQQGWTVGHVEREESGVLPMPWGAPSPDAESGPLVAGIQGGWFHPATGFSLAVAARLADALGQVPPAEARGPVLARLRAHQEHQAGFARKLNWALFCLAEPAHRRPMMERFYRRPHDVIQRFFALDLHLSDRLRIVLGAPPREMRWWPRSLPQEVDR